jgi:hypothetical protein
MYPIFRASTAGGFAAGGASAAAGGPLGGGLGGARSTVGVTVGVPGAGVGSAPAVLGGTAVGLAVTDAFVDRREPMASWPKAMAANPNGPEMATSVR